MNNYFQMLRSNNLKLLMGVILLGFLFHCGNLPSSINQTNSTGSLEVSVQIVSLVLKKLTQITFDSLIIEISAPDMKTIHQAYRITNSRPVVSETIKNIPVGNQRSINIWTVDNDGKIIHQDTGTAPVVQINPNVISQISLTLLPAVGSIYIQIGDVPNTIDQILTSFIEIASQKCWTSIVKRSSPKVFTSLDKIPNNTKGIITVFGIGSAGDTLIQASTEITIDIGKTQSINLSFQSYSGSIAADLKIYQPAVTFVSGNMSKAENDQLESGGLLISEIMYAVNGSEYIELYNPKSVKVVFDTLFCEIDGESKLLTNVSISPKGYFVISRQDLSSALYNSIVVSNLDLSSNGNWITILSKDKVIQDRIIFAGGSNVQEWPNLGNSDKSIILDSSAYDVSSNNYGRNWFAADKLIAGSDTQYGTPGSY